ncbi:hypothetical protein ACFE04_010021 [Oxalis oulophora]
MTRIQDEHKKKLILQDQFDWTLPPYKDTNSEVVVMKLKYVGGVDISFSKEDSSLACACLVVLDFNSLEIVYQDFLLVTLQVPYVPGFLAFREVPFLLQLSHKLKEISPLFYPQVLMVDGNGLLHPRGKSSFGVACHLGVLADLPTIGIGKNVSSCTSMLHHVDGLTQCGVRQLLKAQENNTKDFITLTGHSGYIWGAAMRSTHSSVKPVFISVGHRVSLDTAIKVVKLTCKYRVPEPVRQADIKSREYLRERQM